MSQTFSEFVIVYCDLARHVWYQKIIINEIFKVSANLWKQANGLFLSMYDRFQKLLKLRQKGFLSTRLCFDSKDQCSGWSDAQKTRVVYL